MQSFRDSFFRPLALVGGVLAVVVLLSSFHQQRRSVVSAQTTVTCAAAGATGPVALAPTSIDSTCAQIPYAPYQFKRQEGKGVVATNQEGADMYSWLTFVAVNWPVNPATCEPDPGQSILANPNSPTWMTYISPGDVFKMVGKPDAWCGGQGGQSAGLKGLAAVQQNETARLPLAVRKIALAHPEVKLFLSHDSKSEDLLLSSPMLLQSGPSRLKSILQSTDLPIVDQNGRFARYSIAINHDEYELIDKNTLYTKAGQAAYGDVTFPVSNAANHVMGAMELKAAWKVLGTNDNPAHFFTQKAIVYNGRSGKPSPDGLVTVGLIGLHILHKAEGQNFWAWSTFEQVDNDTTSFFSADCKAPNPNPHNHCVVNKPTADANAMELGPEGKPLQFPTQIQLNDYVVPTNPQFDAAFQGLLANTPWAYYKLISTQWNSGATGVVPQFMASSVQETFVPKLDKEGRVLDGCVACHAGAQDSAGKTTEFSFLLQAKH
jgi:hypothetical protein